MAEGAQECAAHALGVGKARAAGHDLDRLAAGFQERAGGLDAQALDGLGGRRAGLGVKARAKFLGLIAAASARRSTVSGSWRCSRM